MSGVITFVNRNSIGNVTRVRVVPRDEIRDARVELIVGSRRSFEPTSYTLVIITSTGLTHKIAFPYDQPLPPETVEHELMIDAHDVLADLMVGVDTDIMFEHLDDDDIWTRTEHKR